MSIRCTFGFHKWRRMIQTGPNGGLRNVCIRCGDVFGRRKFKKMGNIYQ